MVYHCKKPIHWLLGLSGTFDTLNNNMIDTSQTPTPVPQKPDQPNESTGLNIDEHVKISDPNTGAVILEQRA